MASGHVRTAGVAKTAAKTGVAKHTAASPRRPSSGDIPHTLTSEGVENFVIGESVNAAQESKIVAVKDILEHATGSGGSPALISSLQAILAAASPEDAEVLRRALIPPAEPVIEKRPVSPDDELAPDLREGGYPLQEPDVAQEL